MFLNKQIDDYNLDDFPSKESALFHYLNMTKDFTSSFKDMAIINVDGYNVIDESRSNPYGAKSRFGEYLVQRIPNDEIVYVQPRVGFAGISLAYLCKKYNKNLTLVMPSSKASSEHQRLCIEMGAEPLFCRIAAMPNANRIAKQYAEERNAFFVPLGLKHEYVTANAVKSIYELFKDKEKPKRMWTVISTGVLTRALQIALPETKFMAVAVARNIQHGELGRAKFYSYHKAFTSESDVIPHKFNSERCYDSKGWDYMLRYGQKGDWFFNVAGQAPMSKIKAESIDSYRDWNDLKDFV